MQRQHWLLLLVFTGALAAQDQPSQQATPPPPDLATPPRDTRDVSLNPKKFARNFFSDQKMIWTFPAKVATGHHLVDTAVVLGATAAIAAAADPPSARYFRRHGDTYQPFNDFLSEHRTTSATLIAPAGLYLAGLIKKDSYLAHTGILAAEAWVDVDIVGEVMRNAIRRKRPVDIPPDGNFSATWFHAHGTPFQTEGSFPSGHTAWGFAVATVIARRYPHHKWVAAVAYALAAIDGISRITSSNHFASDTIFGGVLGYSIGRFVVLRQ